MGKRKELLMKVRILFIFFALGVVLLSTESLITGQVIFKHYAFGLAAFGLFIISITTAKAIKSDD